MAKEEDKPEDKKEEKKEGGGAAEGESLEAELAAQKKKKQKKIIVLAVVALVLGGGGAGAFFAMKGGGEAAHKEAAAAEHSAEKTGEAEKPAFYPLGDVLVNLSGEGKRPSYLKVKINLELADAKDVPVMDTIKPRIIDNFQTYLRELRIEDLRGSAGLYRLREALLMRVTETAAPVRIRDVLFQEMLIQ